jgi:hypothetical protein
VPRRWERLTNPFDGVRKVRVIGSDQVFTAMDGEGDYWSARGWEAGVPWTRVLSWGPLEEVEESNADQDA